MVFANRNRRRKDRDTTDLCICSVSCTKAERDDMRLAADLFANGNFSRLVLDLFTKWKKERACFTEQEKHTGLRQAK